MMTDGGDCYAVAGNFMVFSDPGVVLVHGYPTLRRSPWKKFGHAWIEVELEGQVLVKDMSNGKDIEMPRELYYSVGNINPDECRRYTLADLRRYVTETKHWGPWEEKLDGAL